jgi:hypothetical protein
MPEQKRAWGRPKKNWMEGIRKAMNERNLNEGQWEDSKQWSLGVWQCRKAFWSRYIYKMYCVSHLSNISQGLPVLRLIWQRSQYLGYECILSILRIRSVVIMHQTLVVIWNIICCSNIIRSFSKVEFKFCNNIWKQILTFKYMTCYIPVYFTTLPFLPYSKSSLLEKLKITWCLSLGTPVTYYCFHRNLPLDVSRASCIYSTP